MIFLTRKLSSLILGICTEPRIKITLDGLINQWDGKVSVGQLVTNLIMPGIPFAFTVKNKTCIYSILKRATTLRAAAHVLE
ncbi:hypothetical protein KEM48_003894 [Puccinia striiformis f. sp. tritici PST-130]|nr:hypothetical protein KEM48_003894 [Puccinia striiformis f. sp. tritici PST-130]